MLQAIRRLVNLHLYTHTITELHICCDELAARIRTGSCRILVDSVRSTMPVSQTYRMPEREHVTFIRYAARHASSAYAPSWWQRIVERRTNAMVLFSRGWHSTIFVSIHIAYRNKNKKEENTGHCEIVLIESELKKKKLKVKFNMNRWLWKLRKFIDTLTRKQIKKKRKKNGSGLSVNRILKMRSKWMKTFYKKLKYKSGRNDFGTRVKWLGVLKSQLLVLLFSRSATSGDTTQSGKALFYFI